jgi:DNA-binding PadR family transcriptional regulator
MARRAPTSFLPLTTPEYHVLLALGEGSLHGYAMIEAIEQKTGGQATLLPGTLYATLARMEERGMLEEVPPPEDASDARRRYYRVTPLGREVARAESARLKGLLAVAEREDLLPRTS